MANSRAEPKKDGSPEMLAADMPKSLGEKFAGHMKSVALGPKGFASIVNEFKYALADIRHKVVEEATYGRATTPHWREPAAAAQAPGGIHGDAKPPAGDAGPGVHGKAEAPQPDAGGGVHGKAETPEKEADAATKSGKPPAEPKGLGMSYAELTASWEKACEPNPAGREREPAKQPEQAIER